MTIREALNESGRKIGRVHTVKSSVLVVDLFCIERGIESIFDLVKCVCYSKSEVNSDVIEIKVDFMEVIELLLLLGG